jgi:hypothetical protein
MHAATHPGALSTNEAAIMTLPAPWKSFAFSLAILALLAPGVAAGQSTKPISLDGLRESLKIGGLRNAELADIVKQRGVSFELTADHEATLKAAGALPVLLNAVRANFRGETAAARASSTPIPAPSRHRPKTIRDIHSLYIEDMSNGLDEAIKSEIYRQLPGRLVVVLRKADADSVMEGSSKTYEGKGAKIGLKDKTSGAVSITDVSGSVELWASEAGDKSPLKVFKGGGNAKVAQRLVSSLKRAMAPEGQ